MVTNFNFSCGMQIWKDAKIKQTNKKQKEKKTCHDKIGHVKKSLQRQ